MDEIERLDALRHRSQRERGHQDHEKKIAREYEANRAKRREKAMRAAAHVLNIEEWEGPELGQMYAGWTVAILRLILWTRLRPEGDWKDPIEAQVPAGEYKVCSAACAFFTATSLERRYSTRSAGEKLEPGEDVFNEQIWVRSPGYRGGPCGDG